MSKQEEALQHWSEAHRESKIALLLAQATDYSYPASQATAGLQMALVEVPALLEEIERLKGLLRGQGHQSAQAVGLQSQSA